MKKWLMAGTLLMMAALLAGCASTSWGNCDTSWEPSHVAEGTICTDRYQYKFGETVHIRFTVTNTSGKRLVLEPREGELAMDIYVDGGYPDFVEMRWSEGRELGPEWIRLELEPGESRTIEWDVVPPERAFYNVVGAWPRTSGRMAHVGVDIDYEGIKPG